MEKGSHTVNGVEGLNVHIYPSPFKFESRILKETRSIVKLGLASEVLILSSGEPGQPRRERVADKISVHRIRSFFPWTGESPMTKGLLYFEFYVRALLFGLRLRISLINAHSLMVLPLAVALKKLHRAKLIYDPHELETERVGLAGKAQVLSRWVERKLIRSANAVIVVGDSIRQWYVDTYHLKDVYTVRNVPHNTTVPVTNLLREKFAIPSNHLIFLYQGLVSQGRSIMLYLNAFAKARPDQHLVIMGYGDQVDVVREFGRRHGNIHFHEAVKPDVLLEYTASADVGLSLIENVCLSYYYCLPNKFFEYIIAELPQIVSDFPDMGKIIREYNIGWAIPVSELALSETLGKLSHNDILEKRRSLREVKPMFSWEREESVLETVFQRSVQ